MARIRPWEEDRIDAFLARLYPGVYRDYFGALHIAGKSEDGTDNDTMILDLEKDIWNIMVLPVGYYLTTVCPLSDAEMQDANWDGGVAAQAYIDWVNEGPHLPDFHLPRHHL